MSPASTTVAPTAGNSARRHRAWALAIVVFALALTVRLVNYWDMRDSPLLSDDATLADARYYDFRAKSIAGGDIWGDEAFFLGPLYEYFLAIPYALTSQGIPQPKWRLAQATYEPDAAIYTQCVLGALSCAMLGLISRRLFDAVAGWTTGLLAAFFGPAIFFDGLLMAPTLILFAGVVMLWLLLRADRTDRPWAWALAGVGVGVASVAHGANLLIAPMIGVMILATVQRRGGKRTALAALAFSGGTLAPILPITVRNYVVAGDVVLVSSNGGMNFFIGNNATATGTHIVYQYPFKMTSLRDYYVGGKRGPDDPRPSQVSRSVAAEAWSWIRSNPIDAARLWALKFALFWNNVELAINDNYYFFRQFSAVLGLPLVSFGLVAAMGLTGAVCLSGRWRELRAIHLVLVAQVAAFVIMFVLGRYRFLAAACLMILSGGQVAWWIARVRQADHRRLVGSLILLCLFAFGVYWPIQGYDQRRGQANLYAALGSVHMERVRQERDAEALEQALAAFTTAAELPWTERGLLSSRSRLLFQLGNAWELRGDLQKAVDAWRQAVEEVQAEMALPCGDYLPICPLAEMLERRLEMVREKIRRAMRASSATGG